MSLLQNLPYKCYLKLCKELSQEQCIQIAQEAKLSNLKIYKTIKNPQEQLLKDLDRYGLSVNSFNKIITKVFKESSPHQTGSINHQTALRPKCKIAILIGNSKYKHWTKLIMPPIDCDNLGESLKQLGFIVIKITEVNASQLQNCITDLVRIVPESSYWFIYFAGHGYELCGVEYAVGVDCPSNNIKNEHSVSKNYILNELSKCKPLFCILLLDMCRESLDRELNPEPYSTIPTHDSYNMANSDLLVGYSTSPFTSVKEKVMYEKTLTDLLTVNECMTCSSPIQCDSEDFTQSTLVHSNLLKPYFNLYTNLLCKYLCDKTKDFGTLLDCVHAEMEKQNANKPEKRVSGTTKHYLYHKELDNHEVISTNLQKLFASEAYEGLVKIL